MQINKSLAVAISRVKCVKCVCGNVATHASISSRFTTHCAAGASCVRRTESYWDITGIIIVAAVVVGVVAVGREAANTP